MTDGSPVLTLPFPSVRQRYLPLEVFQGLFAKAS
jgi:hypothetical protein